MLVLWGILLALTPVAFGLTALIRPERAKAFCDWFAKSRKVAIVLTVIGWFWTAYEVDTIGIDVFDIIAKRFPGQVWIMAAALAYLTCIWMPRNLPVRALTAILMLFPAELFKTTRLLTPSSGFAAVHIIVLFAYAAAVVGMYGMFYPWRLEKAMTWFGARAVRMRSLGAFSAAVGSGVAIVAFSVA